MPRILRNKVEELSAERFFGQLKRELQGMCHEDTHQQAMACIHDYIVGLYNVMRRAAYAESGIREIILAEAVKLEFLNSPQEFFLKPLDIQVSTKSVTNPREAS